MAQEPYGFKSNPKGPMKLVRAYAFLRGTKKIEGLEPQVQRKMAVFEDGPNFHGKLLPAGIALIDAYPSAFTLHFTDTLLIVVLTVGTNGTVRPQSSFDILVGGCLVLQSCDV